MTKKIREIDVLVETRFEGDFGTIVAWAVGSKLSFVFCPRRCGIRDAAWAVAENLTGQVVTGIRVAGTVKNAAGDPVPRYRVSLA